MINLIGGPRARDPTPSRCNPAPTASLPNNRVPPCAADQRGPLVSPVFSTSTVPLQQSAADLAVIPAASIPSPDPEIPGPAPFNHRAAPPCSLIRSRLPQTLARRSAAAPPCRTSAPTWPRRSAAAPPLQLPAFVPPRRADAHRSFCPRIRPAAAGIPRRTTAGECAARSKFLAAGDVQVALNTATLLQHPRGPPRRTCRPGDALQRSFPELYPCAAAGHRRQLPLAAAPAVLGPR